MEAKLLCDKVWFEIQIEKDAGCLAKEMIYYTERKIIPSEFVNLMKVLMKIFYEAEKEKWSIYTS